MEKGYRWGILAVLLAGFLLATWLGTIYHPWDTELEESGIALLDFSVLGKEAGRNGNTEETVAGRQDAVLANIRDMLFSESSDRVLTRIANAVLSPVSSTAKSISMAAVYMGMRGSYTGYGSNAFSSGFTYTLIIPIVYFLLFYGFEFGRNRVQEMILERREMEGVTWAEKKAIPYLTEGISAFLFLLVSYWVMHGLGALRDSGAFDFLGGAMGSSSAFIVIPAFVILMALMCAFVLLAVAVLVCVVPYYCLMALPVLFVAWLPAWFPMAGRIILCFALEVAVISWLFSRLSQWLNLWNVFTGILKGVRFVIRLILWPIRTIFRL